MWSSPRVVRGASVGVGMALLAACGGIEPATDSLAVAVASSAATSHGASPTPTCMEPAQVHEYWEQYGEDAKHLPDCPDPEPVLDTTHLPEPPSDGLPPELPTTLAEAQRFYDPEDDPHILLEKLPDGTYVGNMVDYAPGWVPPSAVRTVDQYAEWMASRRGNG